MLNFMSVKLEKTRVFLILKRENRQENLQNLTFVILYDILCEDWQLKFTRKGDNMRDINETNTPTDNNQCNHESNHHDELNHEHHHEHHHENYTVKHNKFAYGLVRFLSNVVSKFVFKKEILRNEIKDKKGPFVVISNHAAALDFVNLIGATKKPMNFVISNSFYKTLPARAITQGLGLIPKQQFQTNLKDIHKMKAVIDNGNILVIYPSGLMSEDGTPTPMPIATYNFLKWLKADVYVAKNIGTYFSMPKWRSGGIRKGKTYLDIYKLFNKEELANADLCEIKKKTDEALFFDAYDEQEKYLVEYKNGSNIEGLENILYICPHCRKEFTVKTKNRNTIYCEACGFEEEADKYQFLHKVSDVGEEIRHPSKWNNLIHKILREKVDAGELSDFHSEVEIQMIPDGKKSFEKVGEGNMALTFDHFTLKAKLSGKDVDLSIPTASFAALPFKPGKFIEIQHGDDIYRCYPTYGKVVIKFIDMVKIFYEIHTADCEEKHRIHN